jgi:predicted O-methyltransferase YrrM
VDGFVLLTIAEYTIITGRKDKGSPGESGIHHYHNLSKKAGFAGEFFMKMPSFIRVPNRVRRLFSLVPIVARMLKSGDEDLFTKTRLFDIDKTSSIPALSMSELFGSAWAPDTGEFIKVHPGLTAEIASTLWVETVLISSLVKLIAPKAVLEIGTFRGKTTWHLFHNAPADARIYTIDLPQGEAPSSITDRELAMNKRREFVPHSDRIRQMLIDTRVWDGQLGEKVQFAFIDGDHSYEGVKNDTEKVFRCLDDIACVCWHDALWGGNDLVPKYLNELKDSGYPIFRISEPREICSVALYFTPACMKLMKIDASVKMNQLSK